MKNVRIMIRSEGLRVCTGKMSESVAGTRRSESPDLKREGRFVMI